MTTSFSDPPVDTQSRLILALAAGQGGTITEDEAQDLLDWAHEAAAKCAAEKVVTGELLLLEAVLAKGGFLRRSKDGGCRFEITGQKRDS